MKISQQETAAISDVNTVLETNWGNETRVEYVALSRLRLSPLNVRRKAPTGIDGLADSILAKGLLQNLVAHNIKGGRGKNTLLGVCAGQRRFAALTALREAGKIADTYPVAVKVVSEAEALATSLIENTAREAMHPADLCQAFKLMVEEGRSADYIAALFSVSAITVQRRLKLATVSPRLLDLYREDGISMEQMAAMALTDDHDLQNRLWFDATQKWLRDPHQLRSAITMEEIRADRSPLVAFVGLDAYEAAGGYVRRDLFSEEGRGGYIADVPLLQRLVSDRLTLLSDEYVADGWAWVETREKHDYAELSRYARIPSHTRELTDAEQVEFDRLTEIANKAVEALDAWEADESDERDDDQYEILDDATTDARDALDTYAERLEAWTDEEKATAGVFIILDSNGEVHCERGLIEHVAATDTASPQAKKVAPLHGEKLCRRLTAHRTAVVQVELAAQPTVALALLMNRLIPTVFTDHFGHVRGGQVVEVQVTCSRDKLTREADDMTDSPAWKEIEAQRAKWSAMMPSDYADLMPWLLEAGSDITANLFAFCVAASVDSVSGTDTANPVNALMDTLGVDMTAHWKPTRESYFNHVSKARITDVVTNAVSAEAAAPLAAMKKPEAAQTAERLLADVHWLPEVLANREQAMVMVYGARIDEEDVADDEPKETDSEE